MREGGGRGLSGEEAWWRRREAALALTLVLLVAAIALFRRDFLALPNVRDILDDAAWPAVAAAGMTP